MPKVARQIIEGAEKEGAEILAKAEEEARAIEKAREAAAKKRAHAILHEAQGKALEAKKQILAEAKMSVKQAEVEKKKELIAGVFEEAIARLSKIPLSEFFPKKLAGNPPPGSRLFVAKKDLAWAKRNFAGEVLTAEIPGGYILEFGKKKANNSIEVILESQKDQCLKKALRSMKRLGRG